MIRFVGKAMVTGLIVLGLTACNNSVEESAGDARRPLKVLDASGFADKAGELDPEARFVVGRGPDYKPIGENPAVLFQRLEGSMSERRKVAWQIVDSMLAPQELTIGQESYDVPLWQTWYEGASANPEVGNKIKLFFANVAACIKSNCGKSRIELARETMAANAASPQEKALLQSLTDENLSQRLNQLKFGTLPHGVGTGGTLFSPSFVEHVLANAGGIEDCITHKPSPSDPPPSPDRFTPCMPEFPTSAVMVKTSWVSADDPNPNVPKQPNYFDTSAAGMATLFDRSAWGEGQQGTFDTSKMYSVITRQGHRYGLQAIHFSTKDTREWIWVSLFWSPKPDSDFGEDRPTTIGNYNGGVWANYKMCVTTAFRENDSEPWKSFEASQPTLAAALKANYAAVKADGGRPDAPVTSWCSNPDVEGHPNNHRTNCIGCHQYAGSHNPLAPSAMTQFFDTLNWDDSPDNAKVFPQFGREQTRKTFLADFSWAAAEIQGLENFPRQIRTARLAAKVPKQ